MSGRGFYEQTSLTDEDKQRVLQSAQHIVSPINALQLRREALDAALRLGGFGEATGLVKQAAIIEAYLRGDEA